MLAIINGIQITNLICDGTKADSTQTCSAIGCAESFSDVS